MVLGFLVWASLPWLVMGVGLESGNVPALDSYLRVRDGNPYVIGWHGCVLGSLALGTYWLFRRGGAEMLARYPWLWRGHVDMSARVRWAWVVLVVGAIAAFALLAMMPAPRS